MCVCFHNERRFSTCGYASFDQESIQNFRGLHINICNMSKENNNCTCLIIQAPAIIIAVKLNYWLIISLPHTAVSYKLEGFSSYIIITVCLSKYHTDKITFQHQIVFRWIAIPFTASLLRLSCMNHPMSPLLGYTTYSLVRYVFWILFTNFKWRR